MSAGTPQTLRPTGSGLYTQWINRGAGVENWQTINVAVLVPGSYVETIFHHSLSLRDSYQITWPFADDEDVYVVHHAHVGLGAVGGGDPAALWEPFLRIDGREQRPPFGSTTSVINALVGGGTEIVTDFGVIRVSQAIEWGMDSLNSESELRCGQGWLVATPDTVTP